MLQSTAAYEFAIPSIDFNTFFGGLHPILVRAESYLAEQKGDEAASELQKIIQQ